MRQIGVHRPRAKADEHGKLVNVARLAAFQQHGDGGALLFAHQMLFQRRHRQQRGDGQAFPVQPPVGEYDDVRALAVGAVAGGEQFFESALQIPRPGIEQRDGAHAEIRVAQAADALQCFGGEDGTVQFDDAAILRRRGKKVAVVADVDALVGLDLFADGVDGRVRHLREALLEVRKQRRMRVGERRQRLVRAHGHGRLHAADCHGQDRIFNILVRVAKGRAQARALLLAQRGGGGDGTGDVLKAQYAPRPFAIGALGGEARLDRAIFQQFAGPDIGHEDAAGVEPPAARDARAFLMERAGLGGEDQPALVGEGAAQRAQAVAVQRGADHVAIAVQNGGGAVPRLHHRRIVAVEVAPRRRFLLALPRLGQKHHARERQGHAVHVEKFQRVVQHLRVRAARLDDGQHAAHLFPQQRRAHRLLAGAHAVEVAADGVDLAVVQKQTLRVRLGPAGKGVGGKAGVDHRQRRGVVRILQIVVKGAQLRHQHHALVDDGAAGEGTDVGAGLLLFKLAAEDVEAAVERFPGGGVRGPGEEALADAGHGAPRRGAQQFRAAGHVAPAKHAKPLCRRQRIENAARVVRGDPVVRQEEHAHGVFAFPAEKNARLRRPAGKEHVRQAREDAHAVAGGARGVAAGAVRQPFDDGQRVGYGAVRGLTAQVDHRAHAAGSVLHLRVVERIGARHGVFLHCHAFEASIFAASSGSFSP